MINFPFRILVDYNLSLACRRRYRQQGDYRYADTKLKTAKAFFSRYSTFLKITLLRRSSLFLSYPFSPSCSFSPTVYPPCVFSGTLEQFTKAVSENKLEVTVKSFSRQRYLGS